MAQLVQLDRIKAIEELLEEMPDEDAGLVTLFYLNDLSVKEVAEVMKLSESNVKVRMLRIRKQLKKQLNEKFKNEIYDLF